MKDQQIPPGWYDDGSGRQRWWTGRDWGVSADDWRQQQPIAPAAAVDAGAAQTAAKADAADARAAKREAAQADRAAEHEAVRAARAAEHEAALADRAARHEAAHAQRVAKREEHHAEHARIQDERAAAKTAAAVAKAHAAWAAEMKQADDYLEYLETARPSSTAPILLQSGEQFWLQLPAALAQDRVARQFVAGHQGLSIPIGSLGGRTIRYNVGETRGHAVSGPPEPTIVDHGQVAVTTKRIIYHGKTTLEHRFDKLVSYDAVSPVDFELSVTNRQKTTSLRFERDAAVQFHDVLVVAIAEYRGTREKVIEETRADVAELQATEPR